ncbi:hypothetical protein KEM48_011298 [Puccinia striiformis f. sp. tritici PST-130]|nr:hypothetical protein KEM48_011298 [Puccinia striiformis f. sp. tritici PST-130]
MPRVLSIQSHVVSGYVGNKSATFPLQLLGWDVDALNTVQFSNHLGYGHHGGSKIPVEHLISCIDGLENNGLLTYDAFLQGIDALIYSINKIKARNPNVTYLVDPVMGDDGKLYVSDQVPPKYKELLKLATIATPNEFEAQILTGHSTTTIPDIRHCLQAFHDIHDLKHIVITSISVSISLVAHLDNLPPPDSEGNAAELALATTQGVMDQSSLITPTIDDRSDDTNLSPAAVKARRSELKIIQSRAVVENPTIRWKCHSFDTVVNTIIIPERIESRLGVKKECETVHRLPPFIRQNQPTARRRMTNRNSQRPNTRDFDLALSKSTAQYFFGNPHRVFGLAARAIQRPFHVDWRELHDLADEDEVASYWRGSLGVCDKDQGETPSGAIKTKMAQAAFCIGSKITDQIYMHIFFSCDSNSLEGSIPKFIADIGHCLAHIKFIGLEVKDVNICYKILNKIIHKRPSLSIMFFGDSATMSDPYVLIEKLDPWKYWR